jgi:hypothetical protein
MSGRAAEHSACLGIMSNLLSAEEISQFVSLASEETPRMYAHRSR